MNSIDEHIQFTVEKEENDSLPFLDSLLTHESDGSISTSVYRKKTHTDQYLQFSSHHPLAHTTLFHWAADKSLKDQWIYPSTFIHRSRRSTPHTPTPPCKDGADDVEPTKPRATITLPYVQGLSEPIKKATGPLGHPSEIQSEYDAPTHVGETERPCPP